MNRRDFLTRGLLGAGTMAIAGCREFEAAEHRYKLASESVLPTDIRTAPAEVREAYRFAIANRELFVTSHATAAADMRDTRVTTRAISRTIRSQAISSLTA